jgi:protein-tyrosine-phosphatase/8-oxo-dGTP pyrophosphatase MutT (NUDIX family)
VTFDDALRARFRANLETFSRRAITPDGRRHAAVALVMLADEHGRACFVLTRRAAALKTHSRQWALPGGRLDAGETPQAAALRELQEEVGLALEPSAVLGLLDDYGTRAGFIITPVVMWASGTVELRPNPAEVARVYRVPLADLDHPAVPIVFSIPQSDRPVIQVPLLDNRINAPTAAVIYQMREVVVHGRPTRVDHFEQPVWTWQTRMPSVLFVCHANTARSVMAQALLERMLADRGMTARIRVRSGGIALYVRDGMLPSLDARLTLREVGVHVDENAIVSTDLRAHREVVAASDLILTMTGEQKTTIAAYAEARDKPIFTLREFAGEEGDIADPAGQGEESFRFARDEITRCLERSIDRLLALLSELP